MRRDLLWQFYNSTKGVKGLDDFLDGQSICPKAYLSLKSRLNCRSMSLNFQMKRSVIRRILMGMKTLQRMSEFPTILRKIYFFKRKYARAVFKKRPKVYLMFELVCQIKITNIPAYLHFFQQSSKLLRSNYGLTVGMFIRQNFERNSEVVLINPDLLNNYLYNEKILGVPQLVLLKFRFNRNILLSSNWLLKKINETS